jgi:hypothetical protein
LPAAWGFLFLFFISIAGSTLPERTSEIDFVRAADHSDSRTHNTSDEHSWRAANETNPGANACTGKAAISNGRSTAAKKRTNENHQSNGFHFASPFKS